MQTENRHPRSQRVDRALDRVTVALVRECNEALRLCSSSGDAENVQFWHTQAQKSLASLRDARSRVSASLEFAEDQWAHRLGLAALKKS